MNKNNATKSRLKKWIKTVGTIIGAGVIIFVLWLIYASIQYYPTIGALEHIKNTRLTMQDVTGETLPPKRSEAEYNATVPGLDENKNGIRDDVEHAIFDMKEDSLQMRAAKLQYAQALQLYFSSVRDGETLSTTIHKATAGYGCILDELRESYPGIEQLEYRIDTINSINMYIESLIINTENRNKRWVSAHDIKVTLRNVPDEGCHVIIQ